MSRRGCSLLANASGFDPHRASISSRFGQVVGDGATSTSTSREEARLPSAQAPLWAELSGQPTSSDVLTKPSADGSVAAVASTPSQGESFLRVHWVAVPQAVRARRVNRGRREIRRGWVGQ
jgi:hypothetical protein